MPSEPTPPAFSRAARRAVNLLRKLVRRAPIPWDPQPHPPPISHYVVLHPEMQVPWYRDSTAKLLPGGTHVFFKSLNRLECRSVAEDRLVWRHSPLELDYRTKISDYAACLLEHETIAIAICQLTKHIYNLSIFIEIFTLDLTTNVANEELFTAIPEDFSSDCRCEVCDDIVAVRFRSSSTTTRSVSVFLINWRMASSFLLVDDWLLSLALAPGYLVMSLRDSRAEYRLTAIPLKAIVAWRPNGSDLSRHPTKVAELSTGAHNSIPLNVHFLPTFQRTLWVHESPLHQGRFKVWLHAWLKGDLEDFGLCGYEFLKNETRTQVSWQLITSNRLPDMIIGRDMSLWGHTHGTRVHGQPHNHGIFSPVPSSGSARCREILSVGLPGQAQCVHLSPLSGAITYSTNTELGILYYD